MVSSMPKHMPYAIVLVHVVRDEATDATREEVRRAPDRGNGAGNSNAHAEVRMEKERPDVVHRKLDAEAHAVRDRHQPSVDIREPDLKHDARVALLLRTRLLQLLEL